MKKVVVGDSVVVIAGADKGKIGVVQMVVLKKKKLIERRCVIVSGVNVKGYVKKSTSGSKLDKKEFPIDASNVALTSGESGKHSRVGFRFCEDVKKRFLKKTGVFI